MNEAHEVEAFLERFRQAYDRFERACDGRGGFDWPPGWCPGPLHDPPYTVFPPFTEPRADGAEDTVQDKVSAVLDALIGVDVGPADMQAIALLAQLTDASFTAAIVSLIHRARLAGPIPGRHRPRAIT